MFLFLLLRIIYLVQRTIEKVTIYSKINGTTPKRWFWYENVERVFGLIIYIEICTSFSAFSTRYTLSTEAEEATKHKKYLNVGKCFSISWLFFCKIYTNDTTY